MALLGPEPMSAAARIMRWLIATVIAAMTVSGPGRASAQDAGAPTDRYDLVGGCWALGSAGEAARPLRFQATDLGRYLLLTTDSRFVAADGESVVLTDAPLLAAEWDAAVVSGGVIELRSAVDGAPLVARTDGELAARARRTLRPRRLPSRRLMDVRSSLTSRPG